MENGFQKASIVALGVVFCSIWLSFLTSAPRRSIVQTQHTACPSIEDGSATLYIHGTIFPVVAHFTKHHSERKGLYRHTAPITQPRGKLSQGSALYLSNPKDFPAGSFYKYYWSGELTAVARKKAAQEIYTLLRSHSGPLTIIAHSHGCNVALHLAELAKSEKVTFQVDRLILLAPPVQRTTSNLIHSSIFKRIYSFYSNADVIQIADPQGLYHKSEDPKAPFFSSRTYGETPQLTQARVLVRHKSPGHRDFIHPEFFKQLPLLIDLLDSMQKQGRSHVLINIPHKPDTPYVLELAQGHRTRGIDHCTCNGKHNRHSTHKTEKVLISYHV